MQGKASIHVVDQASFMPLHYAVLRGHLEVVQLLSGEVKDQWEVTACGTAIDIAIRHKNIDMIAYLLSKLGSYLSPLYGEGAFSWTNFWKKTILSTWWGRPFYFATLLGSEEIIRLLLTAKYLRCQDFMEEETPLGSVTFCL